MNAVSVKVPLAFVSVFVFFFFYTEPILMGIVE